MSDLHFVNHGSIFTCTPQTDAGKEWLNTNVESESWQWFGPSLCVDHHYAWNLARAAMIDGLKVD